ncbi:MAG: MFS transporter [Lachnospiraceae bacterium]|nr:MFS transporter [Lachnospiraceae bacterium]
MKKALPRSVYAIFGVIVLLFAGLVYAWSTFSKPLTNIWTPGALTWTSTIVMCAFCIGGLISGRMQKRGINLKVIMIIGAVLMLAGFALSGLLGNATGSILFIFIGFGGLGGLGAGLAYNVILSAVGAWFPDKQGLISGILLMGFGISSFLMGLLYAANVDQMDGKGGIPWYICFLAIGIGCFIFITIGALIVRRPGPEFVAPEPKPGKKRKNTTEPYEDVPTTSMVKRANFWLMFIWATITTVAGFAVVFLGTPIATAAVPTLNNSASLLAMIVGLISIFNGIGRILFGALFDKAGYKVTLLGICICFIVSMGLIILAMLTGSLIFLIIGYVTTGLAFGGVTTSQSAYCNKMFGAKYYAQNLPIMILVILPASFGTKLVQAVQSSLEGGGMSPTGAYIVVLCGVAAICLIAGIIALFIKKPVTAEQKEQA